MAGIEIIALEDKAFWELVNRVTVELLAKQPQALSRWIDGKEAMELLRIKSPTTLQKLRDTGAIRFSQPERKILLYDRESIMAFIERHVREPFK